MIRVCHLSSTILLLGVVSFIGCSGSDDDSDAKAGNPTGSGGTSAATMCEEEGTDCGTVENCCSGLRCDATGDDDAKGNRLYACAACIQGVGAACDPTANDCCTGMNCSDDSATCCVKTDARIDNPGPGCTTDTDCCTYDPNPVVSYQAVAICSGGLCCLRSGSDTSCTSRADWACCSGSATMKTIKDGDYEYDVCRCN